MKAEEDCWRYRYEGEERVSRLFKHGEEIPAGWYDDWRKAKQPEKKRGRPKVKDSDN